MLDSSFVVCYNNYTETAKETRTMSVPAVYTLNAPSFNSNLTSLKKSFNFVIRRMKHLSKNRLTVTLRFENEVDKIKYENYLYRQADY